MLFTVIEYAGASLRVVEMLAGRDVSEPKADPVDDAIPDLTLAAL